MTETENALDRAELAAKARTGDVFSQWDLNLLHDRAAGTAAAGRIGFSELPMRQIQRRILPGVPRSMNMAEPALVDVLRDLATGKAPWPLFLHGLVGTGKTAASLALCDFADSAYYCTIDGLCNVVMGHGDTDPETAWGKIQGAGLVVVDEIGARERVGDLYLSTLQRVLDEREQHAEHRLVAISNVPPTALGDILDDRCVSRLCRGTVYELTGDDRRRAEGPAK